MSSRCGASLLPCLFERLWWTQWSSEKKCLWNLWGQLIIIMPTQADKGRWGNLWNFLCSSLSDQTRVYPCGHSAAYKLGEASQPIWGQVNQHSSRGSAGLLLIISPENRLYHAFGSLTLQPIVVQPQSSSHLCVCVCVFSLKPKDPWQQCSCRPPTTCLIWSKGSCFTLLSADTMRTTMSGHIMYSRKGTLQENKWTYVKLFNQGTYPKLTQNIVKH